MKIDAFRKYFAEGQGEGPDPTRRSFVNTLKIKITGLDEDKPDEVIENVNIHTCELLRETYGFRGRIGFWIDLAVDEVDPWLKVASVNVSMSSPEPDGTDTEVFFLNKARVTGQCRQVFNSVEDSDLNNVVGEEMFWSDFSTASPVSGMATRQDGYISSDETRVAVSIEFVDDFSYVGKAHFPMDLYTNETWKNVFTKNGLRLPDETGNDPKWLSPANPPVTSHICVPLGRGQASFYDFVMSVTDSYDSSFWYDYADESYRIAEKPPTVQAEEVLLQCRAKVIEIDNGGPATVTLQNLCAVGGSYQQLGTSATLQVPRRAVVGRWSEADATAVSLLEEGREKWKTSTKEWTEFHIKDLPREAVIPLPNTSFTIGDDEYQCRSVALWIGAVEPVGGGKTDGLWAHERDRGLRYEGNLNLRALKRTDSDDNGKFVPDHIGVPPYLAPTYPVQVEGVLRPSDQVASWLGQAKDYADGYADDYADLYVDERDDDASGQSDGWTRIDAKKEKFRASEPDTESTTIPAAAQASAEVTGAGADASTAYERHWVLDIPTWKVQLRVPFRPDFGGGHLFHTPFVGSTVLLDVYRDTAQIARYLSWGPDIEMPDEASGGHMLFGVPGFASSQLSHRHDGSGKPVFDVERRNKDDFQEITMKEGQLIIKLSTQKDEQS